MCIRQNDVIVDTQHYADRELYCGILAYHLIQVISYLDNTFNFGTTLVITRVLMSYICDDDRMTGSAL